MKYRELKINVLKDNLEYLNDFLDSLGTEGYYEILFDSERPRPPGGEIIRDDTSVNVYLDEKDLEKELKVIIFLKSNYPDSSYCESRIVETREFEDAYKEFYKPFEIGDKFCIIPVWEKESEQALSLIQKNKIPLYMNPGMAFGTGHHETTKLMLSRIPHLVREGQRIVDMGTGSGILSIAAAKLGVSQILSFDIDPNAVKASQYNKSENIFHKDILYSIEEGGFDHESLLDYEFDLLLANITFAVISKNINHIVKYKTNHFLFSGIITERKEDAFKLFKEKLGGSLIYSEEFNGWEIIEWKKD
ncbi:MAG: 50S ribosomal protein L11 methyltransferase [Leptospiraceae bacterium]|nr:50S ribosomal protein L11 methyltransferase [Leptospiraceae bacterium]MCP5512340.1 50S ribosomal protein L11 methyltransferase [Leptospiraceae bacterium]